MKIEVAIKQTSFRNEYQKLLLNIIYTGNYLQTDVQTKLKPFNLSASQYNILRILRGQYPNEVSVSSVQERMLDKLSDASRLIEKLRQKELVDRKECPSNRRKSDVKITDKGLELLKEIDKGIMEVENMDHCLSEQEAKLMNEYLNKIRTKCNNENK